MTKETTNDEVGKAYAFFYCSATKADIEKELPKARDAAQVPNNLELILTKGINPNDFEHDSQLKELAQKAREADNNYYLTAILPYSTNKDTAKQLGNVQNMLYSSSLQDELHKGDYKAIGAIVFRSGNEYSFVE